MAAGAGHTEAEAGQETPSLGVALARAAGPRQIGTSLFCAMHARTPTL